MRLPTMLFFASACLSPSFGQIAPTEANLRFAAAAGGVAKFSTDGTITLSAPIAIVNDVTLDAGGHSVKIDGGNTTTLFQVSATGKLTLVGLWLGNGRAKGADSPIPGGGPAGSAAGGAIQNSGGQVTALDCEFHNNTATGGSGVLTGLAFWQYNNGGNAFGGAIYQTSGSLVIRGSKFSIFDSNAALAGPGSGPASAFGGAICSLDGSVTIEDVIFNLNYLNAGSNNGLHGEAQAFGGAIYIQNGSLQIKRALFQSSLAGGIANAPANGGAIALKNGTVTIDNSTFLGNKAVGGNGAYYTTAVSVPGYPAFGGALNIGSNATATVRSSTFVENTSKGGADSNAPFDPYNARYADSYGGAIAVQGNAVIVNSTFTRNSALQAAATQVADGGVIYNTGTSALTNVTVAANSARGAILSSPSGTLIIKNTLLAEAHGVTAASGFADGGNNLSATASPTFSQSTSHNNADLKLGPLGLYGGEGWSDELQTIPILNGSAAIDAADDSAAPATDQRGRARPSGAHADVGAFESSAPFHVFGTLNGYLNSSTTVTLDSTSVQPDANGAFAFTVSAGNNSFSFSATNSVFRSNPLVVNVGADTQIQARGFEFSTLAFDPDLDAPTFTLAGRANESWDLYTSDDLQNWSLAATKFFSADGLVSVVVTNSPSHVFVKAIRTDRQLP
ncbi:MAG TPA: choice-of-anchor Q domain-containing protein [Verrucomicrobiae bacterium]